MVSKLLLWAMTLVATVGVKPASAMNPKDAQELLTTVPADVVWLFYDKSSEVTEVNSIKYKLYPNILFNPQTKVWVVKNPALQKWLDDLTLLYLDTPEVKAAYAYTLSKHDFISRYLGVSETRAKQWFAEQNLAAVEHPGQKLQLDRLADFQHRRFVLGVTEDNEAKITSSTDANSVTSIYLRRLSLSPMQVLENLIFQNTMLLDPVDFAANLNPVIVDTLKNLRVLRFEAKVLRSIEKKYQVALHNLKSFTTQIDSEKKCQEWITEEVMRISDGATRAQLEKELQEFFSANSCLAQTEIDFTVKPVVSKPQKYVERGRLGGG